MKILLFLGMAIAAEVVECEIDDKDSLKPGATFRTNFKARLRNNGDILN